MTNPIYKPSELRSFLEGIGIRPKKGLSQNFLIDGNIIRKIVSAANLAEGDIVLEIGPGPGALTEALLGTGAHVIAVEKDPVLAQALQRLSSRGKLEVFCADIMEFSLEHVLMPLLKGNRKAKVVANLPYHLTTPILAALIPLRQWFSSIVVMVQEEVARRFTAHAGNRDYSSFTIFLNFFSDPRYAFFVSRHCFFPEPSVDSAIVTFQLREPPQVDDEKAFFIVTRTAFEHRRKMLRASLKFLYAPKDIMDALICIGKPPEARPEQLSLDDFLKFYHLLSSPSDLDAKPENKN